MKIIKVRDNLMFNSNSNRSHYYAFFWNRRYRKYNAIQLTHIATKDNVRYSQVNNGLIKPVRIKKLDPYADSGIKKAKFINDINGNSLHPSIGVVVVNKVSGSSADKIKRFGTDIYSRGRRIR